MREAGRSPRNGPSSRPTTFKRLHCPALDRAIPFNCRASDSILDAAVRAANAGADLDGKTLAFLLAGDVGHSDVPLRIAYHHHEQPRGHRRILRFGKAYLATKLDEPAPKPLPRVAVANN